MAVGLLSQYRPEGVKNIDELAYPFDLIRSAPGKRSASCAVHIRGRNKFFYRGCLPLLENEIDPAVRQIKLHHAIAVIVIPADVQRARFAEHVSPDRGADHFGP